MPEDNKLAEKMESHLKRTKAQDELERRKIVRLINRVFGKKASPRRVVIEQRGDTIEIRRDKPGERPVIRTFPFGDQFGGPKNGSVLLCSGESRAARAMHIVYGYLKAKSKKHPGVNIERKFPFPDGVRALPKVEVVAGGVMFPKPEYKITYPMERKVPRKITLHRTLPHK